VLLLKVHHMLQKGPPQSRWLAVVQEAYKGKTAFHGVGKASDGAVDGG
jgi:hypothetical protein